MSGAVDGTTSNIRKEDTDPSTSEHEIPALVTVTADGREVWDNYRNVIEAKAQKYFPMPATFQMVPLRMCIVDVEGIKTYFFKARVPNNRFINVRVRQSGKAESRENQVAVESHPSGRVDEAITKIF